MHISEKIFKYNFFCTLFFKFFKDFLNFYVKKLLNSNWSPETIKNGE